MEKTTTVTPCTPIDSEADVALGRVTPGNVWIQASYCEGKDALCIEITSDVAPQTQDLWILNGSVRGRVSSST